MKSRWDILDISPGAGNLHQVRELLPQGHRVEMQLELVHIFFFLNKTGIFLRNYILDTFFRNFTREENIPFISGTLS